MKNENGLNLRQERFCQLFAGGSSRYFGNEVWSYVEAYRIDLPHISYSEFNIEQKKLYNKCTVNACNILANAKVKERCNELLKLSFNDEEVDKQLNKVIQQDEEKSAKVSAIKEYNNLKNRIKKLGDEDNPIYLKTIIINKNGYSDNKSSSEAN